MDFDQRFEIIAERRLLSRENSKTEIFVRIGKPCLQENNRDYFCPWHVSGLGDGRVRRAEGVDGVQALQLALRMISIYLQSIRETKEGLIYWEGEQKGDLGF